MAPHSLCFEDPSRSDFIEASSSASLWTSCCRKTEQHGFAEDAPGSNSLSLAGLEPAIFGSEDQVLNVDVPPATPLPEPSDSNLG